MLEQKYDAKTDRTDWLRVIPKEILADDNNFEDCDFNTSVFGECEDGKIHLPSHTAFFTTSHPVIIKSVDGKWKMLKKEFFKATVEGL